jgi:gas vesicle protein
MRGFSKTDAFGFFIAGAAVGAAVGLVLAPKSGAQTRKEISRFSKKTINKLDDLQCDVREQITEGYEQVMEVFDNVKDYVEDGKNKLQRMMRTA